MRSFIRASRAYENDAILHRGRDRYTFADPLLEKDTVMIVTLYGVGAVSFMMIMYALEGRHRRFIAAFAFGCLLSSAYGFLSGAWPFGVVEAIWSVIAWRRYMSGET